MVPRGWDIGPTSPMGPSPWPSWTARFHGLFHEGQPLYIHTGSGQIGSTGDKWGKGTSQTLAHQKLQSHLGFSCLVKKTSKTACSLLTYCVVQEMNPLFLKKPDSCKVQLICTPHSPHICKQFTNSSWNLMTSLFSSKNKMKCIHCPVAERPVEKSAIFRSGESLSLTHTNFLSTEAMAPSDICSQNYYNYLDFDDCCGWITYTCQARRKDKARKFTSKHFC